MLKLEDIRKDAVITGLEPDQVVRVVYSEMVGDGALTVFYKKADGMPVERMLFRSDETRLSLAQAGRPWVFDAPGEDFKLAVEATRINLAYLFDPMMAVHTSNVTPAPSDYRRLRVPAAAPAPALRAGRRPGRGQDHHGGPVHP